MKHIVGASILILGLSACGAKKDKKGNGSSSNRGQNFSCSEFWDMYVKSLQSYESYRIRTETFDATGNKTSSEVSGADVIEASDERITQASIDGEDRYEYTLERDEYIKSCKESSSSDEDYSDDDYEYEEEDDGIELLAQDDSKSIQVEAGTFTTHYEKYALRSTEGQYTVIESYDMKEAPYLTVREDTSYASGSSEIIELISFK